MKQILEKVEQAYTKAISLAKLLEKNEPSEEESPFIMQLNASLELFRKREIYMLVAGEVKVGKSSLIDNILGEYYCPVNAGICTNVCSMIRYGEQEKITVVFAEDEHGNSPEPKQISKQDIAFYVGEQNNRDNALNVHLIVIETPNEHLKSGLVIIDTPGLGSLNPLHTATTFAMASIADIVLLVSSAEKELTTSEIDMIGKLCKTANTSNVAHVLTHSEQGNPEVVLNENIKHLAGVLGEGAHDLKTCMVSNSLYEDLKTKSEAIEVSGFAELFDIVNSFEKSTDLMFAQRSLADINVITSRMAARIKDMTDACENPDSIDDNIEKLRKLELKLNSINSKAQDWSKKLKTEIDKLAITVNYQIDILFRQVLDNCSSSLEHVDLDNQDECANKITQIVSAGASSMPTKIRQLLIKGGSDALERIYKESELKSVIEDNSVVVSSYGDVGINLGSDNLDDSDIFKKTLVKEFTMRTIFASVTGGTIGAVVGGIGGFFTGGLAGAIVGAKVGAETGAGVGAVLGQAWGAIKGYIIGKQAVREQKKATIMKKVEASLKSHKDEYKCAVKKNLVDFSLLLEKTFKDCVQLEIRSIKSQIQELQQIRIDAAKYNAFVKNLNNNLGNLCDLLADIRSSIAKGETEA